MREGRNVAKPVKLKYLYEDSDRHGNRRLYVRMRGAGKVRLRQNVGTDGFLQEYRTAIQRLHDQLAGKVPAQPKQATIAAPNSLSWLIERYYGSGEFQGLADSTRRVRRLILDKVRSRREGSLPYRRMEARHVTKLRDEKAEFPESANGLVKALRQLFTWAKQKHVKLADSNPAADCPYLPSNNPDGFHTWTLEEVEKFENHHPLGTKAHLALGLLLYTGTRRSDVVQLGRQHVQNGWLKFRVTKGRRRNPKDIEIPVLPDLKVIIDASPTGDLTYLVTAFGKPFSAAGFSNWFRDRCDEAGLPHCSAHGVRKAGAALAAEGGATEKQLMAIYGWETMKQAERYTRRARQKVLASEGMPSIGRGRLVNKSDPPEAQGSAGGSKAGEKP